jgi:hypothetical protein
MYRQQLQYRPIPIQSVSIDLTQDSLEYIEYSLNRLDNFIAELSPQAFYGGYEQKVVLAS